MPAEGDIVFGNVLSPWNGSPVGPMAVPAADLTRGVLMAGTTGSGKTNTVMHVVPHAAKQGWVVVFDIKREYRSLHKTHDAKVYRFTGKNLLTHNIFKPAGPPELWIKQVASIVAEVINRLAPAVGSKDILIQGLDELYRKHGVYDGSTHYPHVGDFLEWLDEFVETRAHPRARGWSESLRRVLNSLAVGSTGRAFRVREGLSMARLMDGITVIELDGLGDPSAEALLASVLVQKIRNTLQDPLPEPALKGLIVVEEAQHLLAQGSEATSVLAATCREIRAYGVGMVYVSQTPSEFSKHALANANTIIVHKLNHPSDRSTAVRILGLDKEHAHLIERLRPGEAIMRSDALAHVRLPKVRRPVVRDDDLPATRVERSDVSSSFAQRGEAKRRYRRLSNRERDAFWAIANSEAIYPRAIREHLRISQKNAKAVLGSLIRGGLVGYCPARKNGHNKPRHIHFLTPLGQEVVRSQDGLAPDRRPKSDPRPHAEVVAEVVERLGVRRIPDRRFDILYEEEGERRAIEVETGSNNDAQILENHRKSVDLQGFSHFVASSARVGNRILQVVAAAAFRSRQSHEVQVADIAAPGSSSRFEFRPAGGG